MNVSSKEYKDAQARKNEAMRSVAEVVSGLIRCRCLDGPMEGMITVFAQKEPPSGWVNIGWGGPNDAGNDGVIKPVM